MLGWYLLALYLVGAALTAAHFKDRVKEANLDLGQVFLALERQAQADVQISRLVTDLGGLRANVSTLQGKADQAREDWTQAKADARSALNALEIQVGLAASNTDTGSEVRWNSQVRMLRDTALNHITDPEVVKALESLNTAERTSEVSQGVLTHARGEALLALDKLARTEMEIRKLSAVKSSAIKDAAASIEGEGVTDMSSGSFARYVDQYALMRAIRFDVFARMPSQLLTLLLTVAMGALGSVIFMTRDYFQGTTRRKLAWYFFRPLLGLSTALVIFALLKAGQMTLGTGGSPAGGAGQNLNPFFTAFLAVVSGIFSEQAYRRIQNAGETFFSTPTTQLPRWGFGLHKVMTEGNHDSKALARFIQVPENKVKAWIQEQEPVPVARQEQISAWLRVPERLLFTDRKPDDHAPESPKPGGGEAQAGGDGQ